MKAAVAVAVFKEERRAFPEDVNTPVDRVAYATPGRVGHVAVCVEVESAPARRAVRAGRVQPDDVANVRADYMPTIDPTRAYYYGIDNSAPVRGCTYNTYNTAIPPAPIANSGELVLNVGTMQAGEALQFRYQNRGEGFSYDQFTVAHGPTSIGPWTVVLSDSTFPTTLVSTTSAWNSASFAFPAGGNYFVRFNFDTIDAIANDFLGVVIDDIQTVRGSCSAGIGPLEVSPTGAAQPLRLAKNGANLNFTFQDKALTPEDYNIYQGTIAALRTNAYDHTAIGCHTQSPTLTCNGTSCTASAIVVGSSNQYFLLTSSAPGGEGPAQGGGSWTGPAWAGPSPPAYSPLICGNNIANPGGWNPGGTGQ